jgi:hypothetical protein
MSLDFRSAQDIRGGINRIEQILATNIFDSDKPDVLMQSAFIEVCIQLYDLLAKSEKFANRRVAFTDHINIIPKQVEDVTDLVSKGRNAGRHVSSDLHLADQEKQNLSSFIVIRGRRPNFIQIGDLMQGCDFADDTAIWYGVHRIYLRRHILRAFEEAKANLLPLLRPPTHDEILGKGLE